MNTLRFVRVALDYGCHGRDVAFPDDGAPVVVAGPNGSGKTTLLEALVRVPFGYNRRQEREGRDHTERRPWSGEGYRARVELVDGRGGTHAIERDFDTARVKIERDGRVAWEGDGNPAGSNIEATAYRERLRALFGIVSPATYARLAWVRQGELVDTRLDEHLLRLASGGTHDVERARTAIENGLRELTRAPVAEGGSAGRAARRLEEIRTRIASVREILAEACAARDRRAPLLGEVERLTARSSAVMAEIEALEAAHVAIGRRDALARERERLEERLFAAEKILRRIEREAEAAARLEAAWTAIDAERRLPPDFPERATRLEQLSERLDHAARRVEQAQAALHRTAIPSAAWTLLPAAAFVCAGAAWWLGHPAIAALAGAGAVGWLTAVVRHRRLAVLTHAERRRACAALDGERSGIVAAVDAERRELPSGGGADLVIARADWLHQDGLRRDRLRAADALARTVADAVELTDGALFRNARSLAAPAPADPRPDAVRAVAERLGERVTALRNRLAESAILAASGEAHSDLRPGMDDATAVGARLRGLRAEREELDAGLRRAERRLVEEGRSSRSPVALEEELADALAEAADIEERIDAHRAAHALVTEAHASFREHDQRRLVAAISIRVLALSGGTLGPVEIDAEDPVRAGVRFGDRLLPLRCPPLSYGQYHAVLLGVRLGASEILAKSGPRLPLILDEPFAHLDESHAAAVWRQLEQVAGERQVVIATQETALLDRLGVTPAVRLSAVAGGAHASRPAPVNPRAARRPQETPGPEV